MDLTRHRCSLVVILGSLALGKSCRLVGELTWVSCGQCRWLTTACGLKVLPLC